MGKLRIPVWRYVLLPFEIIVLIMLFIIWVLCVIINLAVHDSIVALVYIIAKSQGFADTISGFFLTVARVPVEGVNKFISTAAGTCFNHLGIDLCPFKFLSALLIPTPSWSPNIVRSPPRPPPPIHTSTLLFLVL